MNTLSKISTVLVLLFTFSSSHAQIKNAKIEIVKIYGNCGMCEATIEKAGNIKKVSQVDWNNETQMASIKYDTTKTNQSEILKRIALAGYDNKQFLAPDDIYAKLPGCCHYDRVEKSVMVQSEIAVANTVQNQEAIIDTKQELNQLKGIFDNYFSLKEALVKSDQKLASSVSKDLLSNINNVKMDKLSLEEHAVWMTIMGSLKSKADFISSATDIEKQRNIFMELSTNMYDLIKVSKQEVTIYYQHCPMYNDGKGANWLSKENAIKNPYYGSQMLTCGKTVETIK